MLSALITSTCIGNLTKETGSVIHLRCHLAAHMLSAVRRIKSITASALCRDALVRYARRQLREAAQGCPTPEHPHLAVWALGSCPGLPYT